MCLDFVDDFFEYFGGEEIGVEWIGWVVVYGW